MTVSSSTPSAGPASELRLAVIPGDGIGQEVTAEALKVLDAVAPAKIEQTRYDLGAERYLATGEVLPGLGAGRRSAGTTRSCWAPSGASPDDPNLPPGILERGLLLRLRFELDHYVNLRPSRIFPGVPSPLADHVIRRGDVDFVVVREGTEGPYTGNGGALRVGTPAEVATEVSVNTAYGVERVVRDAFAARHAAPQEAHAGPQDQRARARRRRVVRGSSRRWPRSSPRSPSTTSTSTRRRSS